MDSFFLCFQMWTGCQLVRARTLLVSSCCQIKRSVLIKKSIFFYFSWLWSFKRVGIEMTFVPTSPPPLIPIDDKQQVFVIKSENIECNSDEIVSQHECCQTDDKVFYDSVKWIVKCKFLCLTNTIFCRLPRSWKIGQKICFWSRGLRSNGIGTRRLWKTNT